MNSSRGFGVLLLISLLPLALAAGLFIFASFSFLTRDLGTLNLCRARQLEVQNKVGKTLRKLLDLNPKALKLRLMETRAKKSLAIAAQSGNPVALAAAEAFLAKIHLQRQALGLRQKALIASANGALATGGYELPRLLTQEWSRQTTSLNSWLQGSFQGTHSQIPKLAVQEDMPDVAPVYAPASDFEEAQAWTQNWSLKLGTKSWAQKYLNFHGRFQRSCSTSLYPDNDEWIAKLKKAKSWSKAFF